MPTTSFLDVRKMARGTPVTVAGNTITGCMHSARKTVHAASDTFVDGTLGSAHEVRPRNRKVWLYSLLPEERPSPDRRVML